MCGIAGFCDFSMDYMQHRYLWSNTLVNMRKSIAHRGNGIGCSFKAISCFLAIINNPNSPIMAFTDREKVLSFIKAPAEYGKPWFGQLMAGPQLMAYMIQVNY